MPHNENILSSSYFWKMTSFRNLLNKTLVPVTRSQNEGERGFWMFLFLQGSVTHCVTCFKIMSLDRCFLRWILTTHPAINSNVGIITVHPECLHVSKTPLQRESVPCWRLLYKDNNCWWIQLLFCNSPATVHFWLATCSRQESLYDKMKSYLQKSKETCRILKHCEGQGFTGKTTMFWATSDAMNIFLSDWVTENIWMFLDELILKCDPFISGPNKKESDCRQNLNDLRGSSVHEFPHQTCRPLLQSVCVCSPFCFLSWSHI